MASWEDVQRIAGALDGVRPGHAHEGSPTYDIGRHHFARLRLDDQSDREILQFWTQDLATEQVFADRPDTFFRIDTFKVKVSVWAWLDRLGERELSELLHESWLARRGIR